MMSLSIFENDSTLGDISAASFGAGLDDFSIRVSGQFVRSVPSAVQYLLPLISLAAWASGNWRTGATLRDLLNAKGWLITRVTDESGWTGEYIYKLDGVIGSHYSANQIRTQIQNDLAGLFTVSGVTILSRSNPNPAAAPVYNAGNLGTVTVYGNEPGAYQNTGPAASPNNPAGNNALGNNAGDFLGNLGMGLGVSTPVLLLGGLVVVAVMMRR